jgi:hypothetical protein
MAGAPLGVICGGGGITGIIDNSQFSQLVYIILFRMAEPYLFKLCNRVKWMLAMYLNLFIRFVGSIQESVGAIDRLEQVKAESLLYSFRVNLTRSRETAGRLRY